MRGMQLEVAKQRVNELLDKSDLSLEEKRNLLSEMLKNNHRLDAWFEEFKQRMSAVNIVTDVDSEVNNDLSSYYTKGSVRHEVGSLTALAHLNNVPRAIDEAVSLQELREGVADAKRVLDEQSVRVDEYSARPDADVVELRDMLEKQAKLVDAVNKGNKLIAQYKDRIPELRSGKAFDGLVDYAKSTLAIEEIPDPDDPRISPGESFSARIEPLMRDLTLTPLNAPKGQGITAGLRKVNELIDEQALVHGATPGQVRYAKELYAVAAKIPGMSVSLGDFKLCRAWARAVEYIPNVHELVAEFEKRIAKAVWPSTVNSAGNVEALLMALGYCWSVFTLTPSLSAEERAALRDLDVNQQLLGNLISELSYKNDRIDLFVRKTKYAYGIDGLSTFSLGWTESNFAKLEVSHKLAASLALTDIPEDVEVQAPWIAWSLVIPSGLFDDVLDDGDGHGRKGSGKYESFARALCFGSEIQYVVCSSGTILGPIDRKKMRATAATDGTGLLLDALVRGACLALGDPEQCKKKQVGSSSSTKNRRSGVVPDLTNARFMLTAPVQVDLRDALKAVQRGEKHKGGKLTVQFLVRGHPKNQAYGPNMSLRKRIWIQPFWKGPEESRVLLRNYIVKDDGAKPSEDPDVRSD